MSSLADGTRDGMGIEALKLVQIDEPKLHQHLASSVARWNRRSTRCWRPRRNRTVRFARYVSFPNLKKVQHCKHPRFPAHVRLFHKSAQAHEISLRQESRSCQPIKPMSFPFSEFAGRKGNFDSPRTAFRRAIPAGRVGAALALRTSGKAAPEPHSAAL